MTLQLATTQPILLLMPAADDPPPSPSLTERLAELDGRVRDLEHGVAALHARIALLASR